MTDGQRKRVEQYLKLLKQNSPLYETARVLVEDVDIDFEQAIYNTVFAPVLLCFVRWVLDEAQKCGIKRLYFLARDGYQMYLVAEEFCKHSRNQIECRYLYGKNNLLSFNGCFKRCTSP